MKLMTHDEARKAGMLDSPEFEMACRIRFVCASETKDFRDYYFSMVERRDGKAYADELRRRAQEYWNEKKGRG